MPKTVTAKVLTLEDFYGKEQLKEMSDIGMAMARLKGAGFDEASYEMGYRDGFNAARGKTTPMPELPKAVHNLPPLNEEAGEAVKRICDE